MLHIPPVVASVSVVVPLGQSDNVPLIAPGDALTVIVSVTAQAVDGVYVMVAVAATSDPVTTPVAKTVAPVEPMVATPVLLLVHIPPVVASLRLSVAPWHTEAAPLIALVAALTVTIAVVEQLPDE